MTGLGSESGRFHTCSNCEREKSQDTLLVDSKLLRQWIIEDREKRRETYRNNNMLMKGFGRALLMLDELEEKTKMENKSNNNESVGNKATQEASMRELNTSEQNTGKMEHCPTCGASVKVISSDEGTCYYEPIQSAEIEALKKRNDELQEANRAFVNEHERFMQSIIEIASGKNTEAKQFASVPEMLVNMLYSELSRIKEGVKVELSRLMRIAGEGGEYTSAKDAKRILDNLLGEQK